MPRRRVGPINRFEPVFYRSFQNLMKNLPPSLPYLLKTVCDIISSIGAEKNKVVLSPKSRLCDTDADLLCAKLTIRGLKGSLCQITSKGKFSQKY